MQDNQFSYRLLQPNDDYRQAVIEKGGITAEFTLAEVEAMQERNKTSKKEIEAQIMLEKAKMTNIEAHHPFVKDLDGVRLTAAALYKEAKTYVEKAEPMLVSLNSGSYVAKQPFTDNAARFGCGKGIQRRIQVNILCNRFHFVALGRVGIIPF